MNRPIVLGLAMLAGAAIGATAVNGLNTQNKAPGAYAVLDCPPSALMRQIGWVEEGRISGSS